MNRDRAYHSAIRGFSVLFALVGVALLVSTIANGGGPASIGLWLGILFVVVGVGRFWIAGKQAR